MPRYRLDSESPQINFKESFGPSMLVLAGSKLWKCCSVSIHFQLKQKKFPRIILLNIYIYIYIYTYILIILNISINMGSCISKCRNLLFATSRQKDEIHGFSTSHSRKPSSSFNECRGSQILEFVPDDIYIVHILHCSYHFYGSSS